MVPPNTFHDDNDGFRFGVLTKQPNVKGSSFSSTMPRLTDPKPLEPYHRERYGAESSIGPLSLFHPRPLLLPNAGA